MFCVNFRKIEQAEYVEKLPPSCLPYRFLHNLQSFLLWEKVKMFDFFLKPMTRITLLCICSFGKWFCIKSWQTFANLLLLYKAPSNKWLSKRCWKHISVDVCFSNCDKTGNHSSNWEGLSRYHFSFLLGRPRWLSWMCHPTGDRRLRVQPPPRSATFFCGDWSWNIFYGHSLPSADSRRAVVSFWRKNVYNTG